MHKSAKIGLGIGLAALLLVGAGCSKTNSNSNTNVSANNTSSLSSNTNSSTNSTDNASTATVDISNFSFNPVDLAVKTGTTVTWTNNDSVAHTIIGDNGGPSSGSINSGQTYSYTFNTAGTFSYHCSIHPTMIGTVTVSD